MTEHHFIDSLEFAEQSLEIHDKIRASLLPGLAEVLSSDAGELAYRLAGRKFGRDKRALVLEVVGSFPVLCQRCLTELEFSVGIQRTLVLVADESMVPEDDLDDDAVDYLVADRKLDVEQLVEEEVLLSLPVAIHHEAGCVNEAAGNAIKKPSPFDVLESLKRR